MAPANMVVPCGHLPCAGAKTQLGDGAASAHDNVTAAEHLEEFYIPDSGNGGCIHSTGVTVFDSRLGIIVKVSSSVRVVQFLLPVPY